MIATETVEVGTRDKDGKIVVVPVVQSKLDRRTNEPIVTEDRALTPYRALPRAVRERVLGYEVSKTWLPRYQTYTNGVMTGLKCWKCQRDLAGWMPALQAVRGGQPFEAAQIMVNGQPAVRFTPFNHYREGLFRYRRPDGLPGEFSFLHCADCDIRDEDGPDLLACFLAGHDYTRETLKLYTDDFWAQWMWRWSSIELDQRTGPSLSVEDLMKEAAKKRVHR